MAAKVGVAVVGAVVLIIGIVLHAHYGPQHALCTSPLGESAQIYSQAGESISGLPDCGVAGTAFVFSWILIAIGAVAVISSLTSLVRTYRSVSRSSS
jgi:hypothetical protein